MPDQMLGHSTSPPFRAISSNLNSRCSQVLLLSRQVLDLVRCSHNSLDTLVNNLNRPFSSNRQCSNLNSRGILHKLPHLNSSRRFNRSQRQILRPHPRPRQRQRPSSLNRHQRKWLRHLLRDRLQLLQCPQSQAAKYQTLDYLSLQRRIRLNSSNCLNQQ